MRIRLLVPAMALVAPAALSAQRIVPPGRVLGEPRGVVRPHPTPLPPQMLPVARDLAYKRTRMYFDSYPMVAYFDAPGVTDGAVKSWTSFGTGVQAAYRLSGYQSLTMDLTSSYFGGPATTMTAEVGTRIHKQRTNGTVYPFMDVRVGYLSAISNVYTQTAANNAYGRYSDGFGAVAGLGMEIGLSHRFSLTTAGAVMRSAMHYHDYNAGQFTSRNFGLTQFRYTLGIRYNPIRYIRPPGTIGP